MAASEPGARGKPPAVQKMQPQVSETFTHGNRPARTWQTVNSPSLGKRVFAKRSGTQLETAGHTDAAGMPAYFSDRWRERLRNEIKAIAWIKENIPSIPVPGIVCSFDEVDCTFVVMEFVEHAIPATQVPKSKYHLVKDQLDEIVKKL